MLGDGIPAHVQRLGHLPLGLAPYVEPSDSFLRRHGYRHPSALLVRGLVKPLERTLSELGGARPPARVRPIGGSLFVTEVAQLSVTERPTSQRGKTAVEYKQSAAR